MPDSRAVCVDMLDAIGFGVAWEAAALLTLSEPVSGALILELALPSARAALAQLPDLVPGFADSLVHIGLCHP